jgi:hypothetical protein
MNCCSQGAPDETGVRVAEAMSADPLKRRAPTDDPQRSCLNCGRASRPITRKTMLLMLKPELFDLLGEGEYRFCSDPECRIVYFTEGGGANFTTEHLRVRVGLKERVDPIPLCYCFGFELKDAREEIRRTGQTSIPQRIAALIKDGMCACTAMNPAGACCLGEVTRAVKRLMSENV